MIDTFKHLWHDHLVKSFGYVQVGLGALMISMSQLQPFLKPVWYAIIITLLGVLTALIGYRNSRQRLNSTGEDPHGTAE